MRNAAVAMIALTGSVFAEPLTIVALGDSLTAGYGLDQNVGFVPQLQGWLVAQGRDVKVVNAGVSGDTTAGGLARLDWSLSEDADALIVNLGGNDLLRGLDPAGSRANLDAILAKAAARGLPVLLVGLRAPGNYGAAYKDAFDAIFPELAAKYGALVTENYFLPLIDQKTRLLDPALMQADGIHPNAKGVAVLVAVLGPKVLDLLDRVKR
jgi:acyl-CoA thioesterase I